VNRGKENGSIDRNSRTPARREKRRAVLDGGLVQNYPAGRVVLVGVRKGMGIRFSSKGKGERPLIGDQEGFVLLLGGKTKTQDSARVLSHQQSPCIAAASSSQD